MTEETARDAYYYAPQQEANLAKKVGGRVTPGSGNKQEKGDVRKKGVCRIECKATSKKSFSVTKEMLHKIENAALPAGEIPLIQVDFLNEYGRVARSCCVLPMEFLDLVCDVYE